MGPKEVGIQLYQVQVLKDGIPSLESTDLRFYFDMKKVNEFILRRTENRKEEEKDIILNFIVSNL